ncbi:MAG TPA: SDR family NAD(P)-dependent oxidoreductase [Stellaceae bacterium]|nr:SDR family NAD(P)-dependent oxidoreductase [Stellaceae bacterium]
MIQRVWITGASSGIGRELALHYARAGATVAASARRREELDALAAMVPGRIHAFPVDVADAGAMASAVPAIETAIGPLDLAILGAGTFTPLEIDGFDVALFRRHVEINYMGVVHGIAALLPHFLARGSGYFAVIASVAGYRGLPTAAAYGPTKAALINLCEALKPDLDKRGVGISIVNPGFVRTAMTEANKFAMPFLMEPEDAARRIAEGLAAGRFEVAFPRRFTFMLKLARLLPYGLYFRLVRRATGR